MGSRGIALLILNAPAALPPGKTRYPLYRRLGGPQGRSGRVRNISPPPGCDTRTVQPVVSRYTDWATRPTSILQGPQKMSTPTCSPPRAPIERERERERERDAPCPEPIFICLSIKRPRVRGSKAVCPMSQICGMLKNPVMYVKVWITGQTDRPFLARNSVLH
jgi:hypothetical protein